MKKNSPAESQLSLIDVLPQINCNSCASARNAYGNAAQEVVYRLLDITPIRINGSYKTCFDGLKDGIHYEIKSTRLSGGKVVVYDWRMEKERTAGVALRYLLVCHSLNKHRADILQAMLDLPVVIYSLPAAILHGFAMRCPLNKLKRGANSKRDGYHRGLYQNGYRNIPLKWMVSQLAFDEAPLANALGSGPVILRTLTEVP